jgi:hypothetical protein
MDIECHQNVGHEIHEYFELF